MAGTRLLYEAKQISGPFQYPFSNIRTQQKSWERKSEGLSQKITVGYKNQSLPKV